MDIIIRKAKMSDIPIVMQLLEQTDLLTNGALYNTPDYFKVSVKHGIFFIADRPGKGIVGLIHGEKLMGEGAVIWYFTVDKKHRGKGIGKMLLARFEHYCQAKKIQWIFGSSDIDRKTMAFYKKNDYSLSGKYIEFTKNL